MIDFESTGQSNLSEAQKKIASASVGTNMLVLAGPGTGKTHTLVHRVASLVQNEGINPSSELLVLSFSRSAVGEIKKRIGRMVVEGIHDDIRFLNVRTFDSFSTKLLLSTSDDIDLSKASYDDRIKLAVDILSSKDPVALSNMGQIRHIVVDEIQDLVGIRAQLVKQVLINISGGFTLFGDPAQGIFDYLVDQSGIGPTSLEFLSWVRKSYGEGLMEASLDQNFRIRHSGAEIASETRMLIIESESNGKDIHQKLEKIVDSLETAGSAKSPDYEKLDYHKKSIAVLCRTNADVLYTTNELMQRGIPCVAPPHKYEQGIPAWVARLFGQYNHTRISRLVFEEQCRNLLGLDYHPEGMAFWKILKSIEDSDHDYIDLSILRSRLRKGAAWTFDSESYTSSKKILVTTIHQSKGREYDHVLILQTNPVMAETSEDNSYEEAKILYVAATRARENIFRLGRDGLPISSDIQFPSGVERRSGQIRDGRHLMEILPEDVDPLSYVNKKLFPTSLLAQKVQDLLWEQIHPGTHLNLMPQFIKGDLKFIVTWTNPASGKPIPVAWLSDRFSNDLKYLLRSLPNKSNLHYSPLMEGIFVFERITIVLPPFVENIYDPWAESGFCLGLGIKGVITVD